MDDNSPDHQHVKIDDPKNISLGIQQALDTQRRQDLRAATLNYVLLVKKNIGTGETFTAKDMNFFDLIVEGSKVLQPAER